MDSKQVAGDISMAIKIRGRAGSQVVVADYPPWMIIDRDNLSPDDVVTGQLNLMRIATCRCARAHSVHHDSDDAADTDHGQEHAFHPGRGVAARFADPADRQLQAIGMQQVLAARLTGEVDTAFPDGPRRPPPPAENADAPLPPPELVAAFAEAAQRHHGR